MKLKPIFFAVTVALSVALVGCSNDYDPIPANPSPVLTAPFPLKVLWSQSFSGDKSIYSELMPAVEKGIVYAAGRDGEVKAFDLTNGKLIWNHNVNQTGFFSSDKAQLSGGITLAENTILIGSEQGKLYELDKQTGNLNWEQTLPGELLAKPTANQTKIATQTANGYLEVRDLNTGNLVWQETIEPQSLTLLGNASPLIARDRVITGSANGRLMAYSLQTGDLIWQQRLSQPRGSNEIARLSDVIVSPQVENSIVYAVGYNGYFAALSLTDGNAIWRTELSSTTPFLIAGNRIYVVDDKNQLIALSKQTGKQEWIQSDLLHRRLTAPVMWQNRLFIGDFEGYLYEINPNDGQLISKMELDSSGLLTAPIQVNDQLIIQAKNGRLIVLAGK